jgi:hypothetical protein
MSGISAVEGTEVTGVVMNGYEEVSVTLINANETGESDAVEVIVFTGTMDVMSILSSGELTPFMDDDGFSNSTAAEDDDSSGLDDTGRDSLSEFDDFVAEDFRGGNDTAFAHSMDPMELFGNMKNGSIFVPQGWNSPHNVNVTLVGNATGPAPAAKPDTTFVFVMVVPYTETEQTDLEG